MGRFTHEPGIRVLALALAVLVAAAAAITLAAPSARGPWVFSYFLDNGQDGLHLAYSRDGLTWTPLAAGRSILAPTVGGKLMRDPCILLGPDGVYHAVWTTGWYEQGIGIAHSKDLITWSDAAFLPVMVHERRAVNAWAPEIVYDDETGQYLIFWSTTIPGRFPATDESGSVNKEGVALNHRIYRTLTRDFKDYSRAELFFDPGFNVIDATILRDGNRYLMFLKDETLRPEARKDIRLAVADHALGPAVEQQVHSLVVHGHARGHERHPHEGVAGHQKVDDADEGQEQVPLSAEEKADARPSRILAARAGPHNLALPAQRLQFSWIERRQPQRQQIPLPHDARRRNPPHLLQQADQRAGTRQPLGRVQVLPPQQKVGIGVQRHRLHLFAQQRQRLPADPFQVATVAELHSCRCFGI